MAARLANERAPSLNCRYAAPVEKLTKPQSALPFTAM